MFRFRSRWCLASGILAIALSAAAGPTAPARENPPPDTGTEGRIPPDLQRIDRLLHDGHYAAAEDAARWELTRLESDGKGETSEGAQYTERLIESFLQGAKGSRQETLTRAQLAVRLAEKIWGPNSIETARSLERLGRALTRAAIFAEAEEALRRALDIGQSGIGTVSVDTTRVKQSLGELLLHQGQFQQADGIFEDVLAAREDLLSPDHPEIAVTLQFFADSLTQQHQARAAIDLLDRSQQICLQTLGPDHPRLAKTLTALAKALQQVDKYDLAQAHLKRAIEIFEQSNGADSPLLIEPLNVLAGLFSRSGDFGSSRKLLERASDIAEREFEPTDPVSVEQLRALAVLQTRQDDHSAAADLFSEVARRLETRLGPSHWEVARATENWGTALAQADRASEAELLLLKALEMFSRTLGPDNPRVAQTHLNLVPTYENLGELSKARQHGLRALEILDLAGNPSTGMRGRILGNLSNIARRQGDLAGALLLTERAESDLRQAHGPFHPDVARIMQMRAGLLYSSGQFDQAQALALEAETIGRVHLATVLRSATEKEALMIASARFSAVDFQIFMALKHTEDRQRTLPAAWDSVIRARALILDEMMARRRSRSPLNDAGSTEFEREIELATEKLARLVIQGPGEEGLEAYSARVSEATEAKEQAQRTYAARSEEFRRTLARDSAGLSEVAASLPPGSGLVAFKLFDDWAHAAPGNSELPIIGEPTREYVAFLLSSASDRPDLVRLGNAAEIDELFMQWQRSAMNEAFAAGLDSGSRENAYRRAAEDLRRAVWDPLAPYLAGVEKIFIVPDGALNLLDFSVLPAGQMQYLAESELRFHYLSSERDLLPEHPLARSGALLAIGAPDFDSQEQYAAMTKRPVQLAMAEPPSTTVAYRGPRSSCGSFQTMTFEPLPGSFQEASEIRNLWRQSADFGGDATLLSGAAASETAFKRQARGKRVLHLATHGFFLGGDCGSALNPLEGDNVTNENPLLLSGLVLAGANHRASAGPDEDDGILTAEEIAALDLVDTEWAVLSACDTGRGEFRAGEGVFGLQRAFRVAGVRTTIMSLWPVEDQVARQWMTALYRHRFAEGLTTMESVRAAGLELLQHRRAQGLSTHPYYWAGFVASGDWR